jgi:glycerol uptake facilitator-like aquaporin
MSSHVHDFQTTIKESLLRLVFELMGTCLLTSLWLSVVTSGDSIGFFVGFFVLLVFSARISGSHFNPAVTLAFMVRKETGGFSRVLGIAYMLFQIAGGLLGGLLGYTFFQAQPTIKLNPTVNGGYLIFQSIVIQALATAILVFLYLTQTEEKTKLSDDNAITTLIISAAYYVSMYWAASFSIV